ncbi:alpha/beta fold hydrolase [Allokutzneria albata]|uniref:alpha/beta fold hydrolase n=1 Tax=Allokutzneria albata TaxID=211114 RepID=UPI0004C36A99|nr:hypothetical protein [Allokutzneria albata]
MVPYGAAGFRADISDVTCGDVEGDGVWGTADRAFTPALGRRLQSAFRDAEFVEVPGARTLVQ